MTTTTKPKTRYTGVADGEFLASMCDTLSRDEQSMVYHGWFFGDKVWELPEADGDMSFWVSQHPDSTITVEASPPVFREDHVRNALVRIPDGITNDTRFLIEPMWSGGCHPRWDFMTGAWPLFEGFFTMGDDGMFAPLDSSWCTRTLEVELRELGFRDFVVHG